MSEDYMCPITSPALIISEQVCKKVQRLKGGFPCACCKHKMNRQHRDPWVDIHTRKKVAEKPPFDVEVMSGEVDEDAISVA